MQYKIIKDGIYDVDGKRDYMLCIYKAIQFIDQYWR